jgi:hypothetical protein
LLYKVETIRMKNLPPEKWASAELNTMIQWYKCPNNSTMPPKKCDKLARYREICGCADPQPPQLQNGLTTVSLLLPPLPLVQEEELHGLTLPAAAYAEPNKVTAISGPLTLDAADGDLTVIGTAKDALAEAADDDSMEGLLPMVLGCETMLRCSELYLHYKNTVVFQFDARMI